MYVSIYCTQLTRLHNDMYVLIFQSPYCFHCATFVGTFSKVEHVFLVGVGGGVPHYTNHRLHVRLGDVLVSRASFAGPLYIFCNEVEVDTYTGTHKQ